MKLAVKSIALTCALFLGSLAAASAASAQPSGARSILSTQQGVHQLPALDGKLILVAGTIADTLTYKRTLSFYFTSKNDTDWLHVPVIESKVDHTLTMYSISRGEEIIVDAAVTVRDKKVYLVQVMRNKDGNGGLVRWFELAEGGDEYPDGPAYVFKPVSSMKYKAPATVEDVLRTELQRKPVKQ
jgi:hypothetical protein